MKTDYKTILGDILTEVIAETPLMDINIGSNVANMSEDLALLLSDVHFQINVLKHKYDIKPNDLRDMQVTLNNGKKIPTRVIMKSRRK